ncbi:hypothetical protein B0H14DRAFT_2631802 [Mycena olivaceomarginata]|nr:hypothetical protein B0H14DRAFT_2631802 [Mycena olivaceomarginata]
MSDHMFPPLLGDSTHVPFFSVEDAPGWMTARGYALYQEFNLAERLDLLRPHLCAYREQAYVNHPFFQVDRAEDWVAPVLFNAWMRLMRELEEDHAILAFDLDVPSMILHVDSPPAPPETATIPQETVMSKSSWHRGKGKGKPVEEDPIPALKSLMSSTSTASSQSPSRT